MLLDMFLTRSCCFLCLESILGQPKKADTIASLDLGCGSMEGHWLR